jgi:uncharacterized membrane protein
MTTTDPITDQESITVDEPTMRLPRSGGGRVRVRQLFQRAYLAIRGENLLVAVLAGSFFGRWLVADRDSYWLDELYSVATYGVWNDSAAEAVRNLADTSVHPPLYQFVLYYWMDVFGDGERATRSLSNLYITLATLFLFLLLRSATPRRVALLSAVTFSLMHSATAFALETRSYAQTIFLATLSSYALLKMMRLGAERGWRSAVVSPVGLLFMAANVGLLFTHYYNAFLWCAQGLMAVVFVLREEPLRRWAVGLASLAALYGVQGAIFALAWGRILARSFRAGADEYAVEDAVQTPFQLALGVIEPNISPPAVIAWLGIVLLLVVTGRAVLNIARRGRTTSERLADWSILYLICWTILPLLVTYVAFVVADVARYSPRYWLFIVPPLAPLLILVIEESAHLLAAAWHRLHRNSVSRGVVTSSASVLAGLVMVSLVLPGTLRGATAFKADWRRTAQEIVNITRSDPDSSYIILEPSFRPTPLLDYYLSRYSGDVRVTGVIRRHQESRGGQPTLDRMATTIAQYDFMVVPFVHHTTRDFPRTLETLEERYPVWFSDIDRTGRGVIVFTVETQWQ